MKSLAACVVIFAVLLISSYAFLYAIAEQVVR